MSKKLESIQSKMKREADKKKASNLNLDDAVKAGMSRKTSFLPLENIKSNKG